MDLYEEQTQVNFSDVNPVLNLDLVHASEKIQNCVTNYFASMNLDNESIKSKYDSVLVIVKSKIHFMKAIPWKSFLKVTCKITQVTSYRLGIETAFYDQNNQISYISKSEGCMLDYSTRMVRLIKDSMEENKIQSLSSVYPMKFSNLYFPLDGFHLIYSQTVYATDLDYSGHMNNTVYIRYLLNSISNLALTRLSIKDFEIHYVKEALLGDTLQVYNKHIDNTYSFIIKRYDEDIVHAKVIME